jgi:hypothetical protein
MEAKSLLEAQVDDSCFATSHLSGVSGFICWGRESFESDELAQETEAVHQTAFYLNSMPIDFILASCHDFKIRHKKFTQPVCWVRDANVQRDNQNQISLMNEDYPNISSMGA